MKCFPLDDTDYYASDLGAWLCTRTRGVYSADDNLAVNASGGMSVTVTPGLAWLKWDKYWGTVALQDTDLTLIVAAADGMLPRIDAVTCKLDKIANKTETIIKQGIAAATPTLPEIVRDDSCDEIYLASIAVPAGATSITQANITDLRPDETVCGIMRDGVTGIPTGQMITQAQAKFDEWFSTLQDNLSGNQAANLQNQINQLSNRIEVVDELPDTVTNGTIYLVY